MKINMNFWDKYQTCMNKCIYDSKIQGDMYLKLETKRIYRSDHEFLNHHFDDYEKCDISFLDKCRLMFFIGMGNNKKDNLDYTLHYLIDSMVPDIGTSTMLNPDDNDYIADISECADFTKKYIRFKTVKSLSSKMSKAYSIKTADGHGTVNTVFDGTKYGWVDSEETLQKYKVWNSIQIIVYSSKYYKLSLKEAIFNLLNDTNYEFK